MPIRVINKTNNAATFFGPLSANTSQFAPPTAGEASCWPLDDISLINGTQCVESALGPGNARVVTFRNNITQTGSSLTLANPDTDMIADIGGTLTAAVGSAIAQSCIARQLDTGSPPTEDSRIAWFYLDREDDERSWHGFGSATFNHSVAGVAEYFGVEQNRTTTTEAVARTIIPVPCTLTKVRVRYTGTVGTDHELAIMIDGVATVIGTLTGTIGALYDFTPNVHLETLEEISFRVIRSTGAATTCVLEAAVAFVPDEP